MEYIAKWNLPVAFTAPASFKCNPIEMVFAHIKRKFAAIIEKKNEDRSVLATMGGSILRGKDIVRTIQEAVNQTSEETIRKIYSHQLSHLDQYLSEVAQ